MHITNINLLLRLPTTHHIRPYLNLKTVQTILVSQKKNTSKNWNIFIFLTFACYIKESVRKGGGFIITE